jgi:hypothetical protein
MSPLTLQVLRRLTIYAAVLSILLVAAPPLLTRVGWLGPSVDERLARAQRALDVARAYGADPQQADFREAQELLARARQATQRGAGRGAQVEAERARAQAIEAQRRALAERDELRRQATRIVEELDAQLGTLDSLYGQVAPQQTKPEAARLLTLMKQSRATGAALFVAFEQRDYRTVVVRAPEVRAALAAARAQFEAARRR